MSRHAINTRSVNPEIVIWRRGDLVVTTDPLAFDFEVIHGFLKTSYWVPGITRENVEKSVANSLGFALFAAGEQIGFARVVTDYARIAYVCDVFVLPAWCGRGYATWLMECLLAHPALQNLTWMLGTKDAHGLYEKVGFRRHESPERIMTKPRENAWDAPRGQTTAATPGAL